jgi:hypothetical protein
MLTAFRKYFRATGELQSRIRSRHEAFWKDPDAERIRNRKMSASDPMELWKDVPNWQRKLSNKANAREFAIKLGCPVPDLYWRGADVENIDFSKLPAHYVIRPTIGHSSNMVWVMDNGLNLFDDKRYSPEEIRTMLKACVNGNADLEFLIEEFLQNEDGGYRIMDDFKHFCFNGEIACYSKIRRLSPKTGFTTFYDSDWKRIKTVNSIYPYEADYPAPACLDEMINHTKRISKAYEIFVRLDFYATPKGVVFGEFTPTPGMGKKFTRFGEKLMLRYWDKYCKGLI